MDFLVMIAENFIGIFDAGGENLVGLITGILPTLIVLLTFVNALIALIGEERVSKFAQICTRNIILRYSVFPLLAVFSYEPNVLLLWSFLKEKQKPAFYDSAVSLVHPITGLFPHANAGELFVWTGIASGLTTLGLSTMPLAVRYFLVGLVVITIRGVVTELLTKLMWKETTE